MDYTFPDGFDFSRVRIAWKPADAASINAYLQSLPPEEAQKTYKAILGLTGSNKLNLAGPTGPTSQDALNRRRARSGNPDAVRGARAADLNSMAAAGQLGAPAPPAPMPGANPMEAVQSLANILELSGTAQQGMPSQGLPEMLLSKYLKAHLQ